MTTKANETIINRENQTCEGACSCCKCEAGKCRCGDNCKCCTCVDCKCS
jgi:hypothetical protein